MTTPEKLKARQLQIIAEEAKTRKWVRIEGMVLGLLLIVIAVSSILDEREDGRQDECLTKQVVALTEALQSRSVQTGRLNDATGDVLDSFVKAAAKSEPGQSEAERQKNSEPIIEALQRYGQVRKAVKLDRAANPFPPFPTGKCDR